jgi:hypothetical protein
MSKLNLATIKKLTGNALTAAALREAGVTLVPILPDGSLADLALAAFIQAGQPANEFFTHDGDDYKLVPPEEWERSRHVKAGPAKFDPINGEPLSDAALAAYTALAPIKVLGGGTVPTIELIAYGAEMKLLPSDLTSREARRFFTSGTDAVAPPEDLKPAARAWPYDKNAAEIARRRLDRGVPAAPPLGKSLAASQTVAMSSPDSGRMTDLLAKMYTAGELARDMRHVAKVGAVLNSCPNADVVAPNHFFHEFVSIIHRQGLGPELRAALVERRPNWRSQIDSAAMR